MKKFIPILIVFLIVSCTHKKELDGFWYGRINYEKHGIPVLIKFENNTYIDYFGVPHDTLTYKYFGNNFFSKSEHLRSKYKFKIKRKNNRIAIHYPESENVLNLKKSEHSNFVFDYLSDSSLQIELPTGNGTKEIIGRSLRLLKPLYLTYKDETLVSNFFDTTVVVDSNYYKFLLSQINLEYGMEIPKYSVSLIIDKNVKIRALNLLKKQLNIIGYFRIDYILATEQYDSVNRFSLKLPPLTQEEYEKYNTNENLLPAPPPPPPFYDIELLKTYSPIVIINGNKFKLNGIDLTEVEFRKQIKEQILSSPNLTILFFLTDNSVYQDYIRFIDIILNLYHDLRDNYLIEKYGQKFNEPNNLSEDELDEVKDKFPIRLIELDSKE